MGISRLYSQWLRAKNYRGVITRDMPKYVSSLCIDFNSLIHKAAGITYGYNPYRAERVEYIKNSQAATLELEFFKQITSSLLEILESVKPRNVLILAVDGVAPQAKIQQQRQRRYEASMSHSADVVFDRNSITPGTEMMVRLDTYLTNWVSKNGYIAQMPKMVIYSGHLTPGEGEHKIMDFIRKGVLDGSGAHFIYGLDADLTMLSMLSSLNRLYLYREDSEEIVDIDNLREAIIYETKNNNGIPDFVFMMSMLGNDFLPVIPSFKDKKEGIDEILRAYVEVGRSIIKDDQINWEAFKEILENLAGHEKDYLILLSKAKTEYPIEAFEHAFVNDSLDMTIFRKAWYTTHLTPLGNPDDVAIIENILTTSLIPDINIVAKEMVNKYLLGMAWVYTYYSTGAINYSYLYDYFFAPLINDFVFGEAPLEEDYQYNEDIKMFHPFYQLISVIPPASVEVLPTVLKKLYKSTSTIIDMLPSKVIVDLQGASYDERNEKTRAWEGVVVIPPVDITRVIDAVRNLDISDRKWSSYNPKFQTQTIKPHEIEVSEREQRLITKSIRQERNSKNYVNPGHDPNAWRATHILF